MCKVIESRTVLVICAPFLLFIEMKKLFRQLIRGSAIDCTYLLWISLTHLQKRFNFSTYFGFLGLAAAYLHIPFGKHLRMRGIRTTIVVAEGMNFNLKRRCFLRLNQERASQNAANAKKENKHFFAA